MRDITLEELLEAGCHFGHQVTRHNPKSRDFVFEARDNIHIIDLAKTKEGLEAAGDFVKALAARGGVLVILATKRQARSIVAEALQKVAATGATEGLFSVTNRWIGGILTNFSEVAKNYKKLKDITARLKNDDEKAGYTKKEIGLWEKNRVKLESFYGGVSDMKKIPDALFIVDTHLEDLAVREARAMHVLTAGIVDTNADPALIDYPIPANDDAVGSIKLIVDYIIDSWIEGKKNLESKVQSSELEKEEVKEKEKTSETKVEKPKRGRKKKDAKISSA